MTCFLNCRFMRCYKLCIAFSMKGKPCQVLIKCPHPLYLVLSLCTRRTEWRSHVPAKQVWRDACWRYSGCGILIFWGELYQWKTELLVIRTCCTSLSRTRWETGSGNCPSARSWPNPVSRKVWDFSVVSPLGAVLSRFARGAYPLGFHLATFLFFGLQCTCRPPGGDDVAAPKLVWDWGSLTGPGVFSNTFLAPWTRFKENRKR